METHEIGMSDTMDLENQYFERFPTDDDGVDFMTNVLSRGDTNLPEHVQRVRDGFDQADSRYWQFMIAEHHYSEQQLEMFV